MKNLHAFIHLFLLIFVAVAGLVASVAIHQYQTIQEKVLAKATLYTIANTLDMARIQALQQKKSVFLCPSIDGKSCNLLGWHQGIRLYKQGITLDFIKIKTQGRLSLNCFGDVHRLKIEADGTTHQNGHFTYRHSKLKQPHKLYFNKRLKARLATDSES